VSQDASGFFGRPLDGVRLLTTGRLRSVLDRTVLADGRRFRQAHLFVVFRRV
jgi:hypothetical protein